MIRVRPVRDGDPEDLAPRLREADRREIEAATGQPPLQALLQGVAWSDPCYAVEDGEGNVIAIYGAAPDQRRPPGEAGIAWLLGSDRLTENPFQALRASRRLIDDLQGRFQVLWNYVDARNEVHLRWLRWCGFSFVHLEKEHGAGRMPFYRFERRQPPGGETSPPPFSGR